MTIIKVNLEDFMYSVSEKKTGLIIGNGFSMNFDKQFSDIYDSLKEASYLISKTGHFKISPAATPITRDVIKGNYSEVMNYIRTLNQSQIEEIFTDAISFASFISENSKVWEFLSESKHIHRLSIGPDMLQIAKNISEVGNLRGFQYINIENWPILIWLYHLIEDHEEFKKFQEQPNRFIFVLKIGGRKVAFERATNDVMMRASFNGFSIYYRILMMTIIFGKGKAVSLNELENIDSIPRDSLINWLENFSEIFSLNFDRIIEEFAGLPVPHLHGEFQENFEGYNFFQSFSLEYKNKKYFTNDIILGSYIINKVLDGMVQKLGMKNHLYTIYPSDPLKLLGDKIRNSQLNHIVFFGMHPENDYHIISGIYFNCLQSNINHLLLTYCYFNEKEIAHFTETWHHVVSSIYKGKKSFITVTLNFVDSKKIVHTYFK